MASRSSAPNVLVVEDERELADLYADYLASDYNVRTAYNGEQAMEHLDSDPDVVLLDRRMPAMSGDEVVDEIRDRDMDTRIAMVTAVGPDFDIIEMGIDDYLVKPVVKEDVVDVVERLLKTDDLPAIKKELSSKRVKRNVLEVEKDSEELSENEEFNRLVARIERLQTEMEQLESEDTDQNQTGSSGL